MFGHDDHHTQDNNNDHGDDQQAAPVPDGALTHEAVQPSGPPPSELPPVGDTEAGNFMTDDAPATTPSEPPTVEPTAPAAATPSSPAVAADDNGLLDLKQQALQQLTPLVGHLKQTPEEKFRTTMMMIQASDNDSLIKSAYEAALAIPDEKARAQALLDIVNEINYFTQQNAEAEA